MTACGRAFPLCGCTRGALPVGIRGCAIFFAMIGGSR